MIFQIAVIIFICRTIAGFTVNEALQYAVCISQCSEKSCRDGCTAKKDLYTIAGVSTDAANFNATLHCRDINLLTIKHNPGIYVIEVGTSNTWEEASVTRGDISIFSNLQAGESYRYRVRRVTGNVTSPPEITPWFTTSNSGAIPEAVKGIYIQNISSDDANDNQLMAEIAFLPAEDRSCFYDILLLHDDEGLSMGEVNATRKFTFKLRHLEYHRNNTIIISAKNNGSSRSSANVSLVFETPTCLQIHRNLTVCPPDQVTGLKVKSLKQQESNYKFAVSWSRPQFLPDNYTLQIGPIDGLKDPYVITVPGNSTEIRYSLENVSLQHIISIVAESPGGISIPASILNVLNQNDSDLTSAFNEAVVILPLVALIAVVITIIYVYCRHKKLKDCRNPYQYCTNFNQKAIFNPLYEKPKLTEVKNKVEDDPLIPRDQFELKPMQLRIKDVLGSGFCGVVRLGSLKIDENQSIDVAVKMLKDCPSPEDVKNFHHEIMIMKSAGKHPNIVSLIGCCTSEIRPMLVVEYCCNGDLQTYLRNIWENITEDSINRKATCKLRNEVNNRDEKFLVPKYENNPEVAVSNQLYDIQQDMVSSNGDITVTDLLSIALQIANGMEYLSINKIVHRDLAARNVLVCGDRTVKISDFGLSRDIYQENIYKKQGDGKLPLKWMAIEALTHQIYTSQSDVWSFGILLWEIVTLGGNPYPNTPTNMILQVLKPGYRMERPQNCGKELYDIMLSCWRTRPRSRPTFTDLKRNLEKLLQTVSHHEYLNLYDIHHEPRSVHSSD